MKKLYVGSLLITSIIGLASCKNGLDLSKYESISCNVYAKYEERAVISYDTDFSLDGIALHDSNHTKKVISTLVPGDKLNIYYEGDAVEYVSVDKAELVKISISISAVPGDERIEMFTDEKGIVIDSSNIQYIIKDDSSYIPLDEYASLHTFYGTYNPENNIQTTDFTTLVKLEAVYSYTPR